MLDTVTVFLTWVSALGCGLMAGVFFAFSAFVMKGLARLPPEQGIAAMQAINASALSPVFLGAFVGGALACALLAVTSALTWDDAGARLRLLGGVVYLVGGFGVTAAFNVPRNNALATVNGVGADAALLWSRYVAGWTAWNHVRTVACLAALALLIRALR